MNSIASQCGQTHQFDVLIIGSGLSGLMSALSLSARMPACQIALLSKESLEESNSFYAQGGIAISQNQEDDIGLHIKDTEIAGDRLCFMPAVTEIIKKSPALLCSLEHFDVHFEKEHDGKYSLGIEGGHTKRRIYHMGDRTGEQLIKSLLQKVKEQDNITCFSYHIAVNLITHKTPFSPKEPTEVIGAYVLNEANDEIDTFLAKATVLATGGAGKTYRYTSNPSIATGDGLAMAYRAGADVSNMEFYQFHPTLLYHQGLNNFLISEALRGEGAILLNGDTLKPFMANYHPQLKELATRDIVSRAIFCEIEKAQAKHVWLDISHQSKDFLAKRFPKIFTKLLSIGIDISQDPIPVVPAAHYQCGGISANVNGETSINRLFAIGEVASTGFHGANRLASNSLLEAAVMGQLVIDKLQPLCHAPYNFSDISPWHSGTAVNARRASQISAHWKGIRSEMTSYAGIIRTSAGLKDVLALVKTRKRIIEDYYWQHRITRDLIELRNIIQVAELIIQAALKRTSSHGGHFREDLFDA